VEEERCVGDATTDGLEDVARDEEVGGTKLNPAVEGTAARHKAAIRLLLTMVA